MAVTYARQTDGLCDNWASHGERPTYIGSPARGGLLLGPTYPSILPRVRMFVPLVECRCRSRLTIA
jgi:hypothetical protein